MLTVLSVMRPKWCLGMAGGEEHRLPAHVMVLYILRVGEELTFLTPQPD